MLRHLTPLRHPYLLGGAISGALMAGVVAAFIAVTGLVAHRGLPDATPGISSSPSGTLTIPIAHAHPSRHAPGALTAATRSTPFSLTVPTTSITAPPPTVTAAVARTPTGAGQPSRHRHPARHRDGKSGGRGGRSPSDSGVLAKVGTTQTQTTQGAAAKTGAGDATPAPAAHTSAPSVAPSTTHGPSSPPPGLAKKPGGLPPGLAKKPGGLPPGLAKKPGGLPPGQAKKHG